MIMKITAAALHDVSETHGDMFNHKALSNTWEQVQSRVASEGSSFLTKALPRLGKAFDKAISGQQPLNASKLRFSSLPGTELPKFLGEFFKKVLDSDGNLLPKPCVDSVRVIRQFMYLWYKYELPYSVEQEQQVVSQFLQTEDDLGLSDARLEILERDLNLPSNSTLRRRRPCAQGCARGDGGRCSDTTESLVRSCRRISNRQDYIRQVLREAKILLARVFSSFDPKDIYPRHGPGAVATKQRLWDKYLWSNVSANITKYFELDTYFYVSLNHVCDAVQSINALTEVSHSARVILVPKDSRGPRLISAEPVDYQWIQQGLRDTIVKLVESHPLTMWNIHFTNQQSNQYGALLGSRYGNYATLDLKEASDRISARLVRLLFPAHIYEAMEACRSSTTMLPNGEVVNLRKFAPMGSSLCFPVLALTIWAILTAGTCDTDTRESILVYGDDVVVPTAYAGDAIELLESFGLLVNRDKSCTKGLFRESCGVDAFNGYNVTPLKLKKVWSSSRTATHLESWVAYANSFFRAGYYTTYELIVEELNRMYGPIPSLDMHLACPSLVYVAPNISLRSRSNLDYQCQEFRVWSTKTPVIEHEVPGWSELLRYFAEHANPLNRYPRDLHLEDRLLGALVSTGDKLFVFPLEEGEPFRASTYTRRDTTKLVRVWRCPSTQDQAPLNKELIPGVAREG